MQSDLHIKFGVNGKNYKQTNKQQQISLKSLNFSTCV